MLNHTTRPRTRRGVALAKLLIILPVLLAIMALNMDGGATFDERRHAQTAADAAALAAGGELYTNYWTSKGKDASGSARAAALEVAAANGYPSSAVTVLIPPESGTYKGQPGHAEVRIDTTAATTYARTFTGGEVRVGARAVARGEPLKFGIVLLNPNKAGAFNNNAVAFALVGRPLLVNSSSPQALKSSSLVFLSLSRIDVTGGVGNAGLLSITTRVRTGVRPTLDPLAQLPVPTTAGAPVRSSSPLTLDGLVYVLEPGVYKGGIRITGLSIVVMTPGVYIMEGGGFQVDGLATVTGLGTMVYNSTSPTYPAGPISITALGKVVMTTPLAGTYQGLNFFQHHGLSQPVSIIGVGLTARAAPSAPPVTA